MNKNETIRITAVENGFLVELAPDPQFFGSGEQSKDYVENSIRVFETIESLVGWLQGHFTYRPDVKPADQWSPDLWSPEEIKALQAKGAAPFVFDRTSWPQSQWGLQGPALASDTLAPVDGTG